MTGLAVVVSMVFGLLIGSFLNVVIWRVPRGESLMKPGSHCPSCDHAIRWYDNIPIISWLVLRGKCRDCGAKISARYPLVEAATAVLFGLTAWLFSTHLTSAAGWVELVGYLWLAAAAVALTMVDLDHHRLPDAIVFPSIGVVGVLLAVSAGLSGNWGQFGRAVVGASILFVLYFLMLVIYPSGMGFGDVKLAWLLGLGMAWVGWGALIVGGFAAFLLGGIFGIALMAVKKAGRKTGIPFGPWMILGAAIGIAWGNNCSPRTLRRSHDRAESLKNTLRPADTHMDPRAPTAQ